MRCHEGCSSINEIPSLVMKNAQALTSLDLCHAVSQRMLKYHGMNVCVRRDCYVCLGGDEEGEAW